MASDINQSSTAYKAFKRIVGMLINYVKKRFILKEKVSDAQDWKRRKAEVLWKEAVELQNSGNFVKALSKWADSAKFEADSSDPRLDFLANVYNEIGYCNYRNRNYGESKEYYELSLETYKKLSIFRGSSTAYTMNNYALLLLEIGEEVRAEKMIKESLKILEKSVGNDSPLLVYVLNNMARAFNRLKLYKESEKILNRAIEIEGKMMVKESPEVITTLELLAVAAFNLQEFERAEALFLQVVKIREDSKGEMHVGVISALFALGNFYSDIGEYNKSEPVFNRCMEILSHNYGPEHRFIGVFFNQLGWIAARREQLEQAEVYFFMAVVIAEKFTLSHRIEAAVCLYNSVLLDCKKNDYEQVWDKLLKSWSLLASSGNADYLPVIQFAVTKVLDQRNQSTLAAFFGKITVQKTIELLENEQSSPSLPRWLITPKDYEVTDYVYDLLCRLGRLKEAQAMNVRLDPYRVHVTTLHEKTSNYLSAFWELTAVEKVWESHYNAWLKQAHLWGSDVDKKRKYDDEYEHYQLIKKNKKPTRDGSGEPQLPQRESQYNNMDELIEGLAILLEKFRVAKVRID
ncbi:MAG: tetratricopeptide repeat protein [Magnetococcales bacterium]|nr:tetratricopeptide repeat protein [Magnetococcales bacterium]